jgi:heme/copper-type cytochrome/quinol oxidase subunit 2
LLSILASEAAVHHAELPIPAFFYGVIAMGVFLVLGGVAWSYRNVANRHDHKTSSQQAHH